MSLYNSFVCIIIVYTHIYLTNYNIYNYSHSFNNIDLVKQNYEKPREYYEKSQFKFDKNCIRSLINIFNNIRSMYPLQYGKNLNYCDDECNNEEYLF